MNELYAKFLFGGAREQNFAYFNQYFLLFLKDTQFHSLKVTNEIETLNLILSSERIYHDLNEVLDCYKVIRFSHCLTHFLGSMQIM